jgi:hypothetical protein
MSVKETPLARVKRLHGSKESLVDSLVSSLDHDDESDDELRTRLLTVSNKKLLRLDAALKAVSEKYGSKDKLVEALCAQRGMIRDADYAAKLRTLPITRLLDMTRQRSRTRA